MMTNRLILISLILYMSSSVDSLKLGNICKQNVYSFKGLEVNSFYKISQHVSLGSNESLEMFIKKYFFLFQSDQFSKRWFILF